MNSKKRLNKQKSRYLPSETFKEFKVAHREYRDIFENKKKEQKQ
jgi:hypothetical protein